MQTQAKLNYGDGPWGAKSMIYLDPWNTACFGTDDRSLNPFGTMMSLASPLPSDALPR